MSNASSGVSLADQATLRPPAERDRLRAGLAGALALIATAAVVALSVRWSAGLETRISVPRLLWLAYLAAAWLAVPAALWRDRRLEVPLRRLYGVFLAAVALRAVAQTAVAIGGREWTPALTLGHAALCLAGLLVWRRTVRPADEGGRRALAYSSTLALGLAAEIAFAGMALGSGEHERAVYRASAEAPLGFVNLVTAVVLLFALADLVSRLRQLYFPGERGGRRRRRGWGLGAAATLLFAGTAWAGWDWMVGVELEAKLFSDVGTWISDSNKKFSAHFKDDLESGIADYFAGDGDGAWVVEPVDHDHAYSDATWEPGGPARTLTEAMLAWRRSLPEVLQSAFKIHLLDEVISDREAVARIRFEVTGRHHNHFGMFRFRFERGTDDRFRVVDGELLEGRSVAGSGELFVDAAAERGLAFYMARDARFEPGADCDQHPCSGPDRLKFQTMRHAYAGAATGDIDGDGWDDVFLASGSRPALFRNRGDGSFEDVTGQRGLPVLWHVNSGGFADLDNDGDQDFYAGAYWGPNYLFANNGDGTFTEVTERSGPAFGDLETVTVFSFFDYDGDGDLDLYLGRYIDSRTEIPDSFLWARNGTADRLFRNDGDLTFTDVTEQAGLGDTGLALAIAAADYDFDGDQDLYLANDFGRNLLYENQGDGTFRDVAAEVGAQAVGQSMSASWGDYDNDGLLDLYVAAIRSNQRWFIQPINAMRVVLKHVREGKIVTNPYFSDLRETMGDEWLNTGNYSMAGNYLLHRREDGTFEDLAEATGTRPAGWYWSSGFFDVDHDGDLDILATDGWLTGEDPFDL